MPLTFALLLELNLGDASPHAPYFASLPPRADVPLFWSVEQRRELEGTDALEVRSIVPAPDAPPTLGSPILFPSFSHPRKIQSPYASTLELLASIRSPRASYATSHILLALPSLSPIWSRTLSHNPTGCAGRVGEREPGVEPVGTALLRAAPGGLPRLHIHAARVSGGAVVSDQPLICRGRRARGGACTTSGPF
eukprot:9470779-Pyramimonas_sp.AAC.3